MIVLIAGTSHTGKTLLAQKILEKYKYPYLSIDHLKMGLIRSKNTDLTPDDNDKLTDYLWPIIREIIKTVIENKQNLVVEGCYIPFNWKDDFCPVYLQQIKYYCLVMTESYIKKNFDKICEYRNVIENRIEDSWLSEERLIEENNYNFHMCQKFNCDFILIDEIYQVDITLEDSDSNTFRGVSVYLKD